jgi:DNA-binding XRE family transcriptional regulator
MDGQQYVMIPRAQWEVIAARLGDAASALPEPPPAADGSYGIEHVRISLANKVIAQRKAAGITQAELARRAGVRAETVCRLEAGKHMPSAQTFDRLHRVLRRATR